MTRILLILALLLLAIPARADCSHQRDLAMRAEHDDTAYALAVGAWGLCAEKDAHFGEAHRLVSRALEAAPPETTAAGKASPWPSLRAALRRLDDRVARVLVTFDGDLWIDGHSTGAVSGAVLAVDPGRHVFEQRGKAHAAKEVEARAGDLPTVDLRSLVTPIPSEKTRAFAAAEGSKPAPLVTPSFFAPALTPRGVSITVAYVGLGTSLVSLIVAGVLEAQRGSLASGLARDACPTPDASARCAELAQVFQQRMGARNVALAAGGVAVLAGGVAVGVFFASERAPSAGVITVGGLW